jgi:hypothetical protein
MASLSDISSFWRRAQPVDPVNAPPPPGGMADTYGAPGMPQFSAPPNARDVYAPIKLPIDRDVALQDLPPGFALTDAGITDPQGNPARTMSPSLGEVASFIMQAMQPGGTAGAVAKAVAGGVHQGGSVFGVGPTLTKAGKATKAAEAPVYNMFDYSRLGETPNVPQFNLARPAPAKASTVSARMEDLVNNPEVRDLVMQHIQKGVEMGGPKWYNTEPLQETFRSVIGGAERGDEAYRKYLEFVAATSPRSDVDTNVRNASYYYGRWMRGEGMPEITDKLPQPYGHLAQKLHKQNAATVAGPGWDLMKNPKPPSFVENLAGNQLPGTMDAHAYKLPAILSGDPRFISNSFKADKTSVPLKIRDMVLRGEMPMEDVKAVHWEGQPNVNTEYAPLERYYQGIGREMGLTPAQTQSSGWIGGGDVTGLGSDSSLPFLGFVENRARYTGQKRGVDPVKALEDMILGRASFLAAPVAVGGAAAAGAAGLLGDRDQQ